MKHKWKIEPRGKITKYYICKRCGTRAVATSLKRADATWPSCPE